MLYYSSLDVYYYETNIKLVIFYRITEQYATLNTYHLGNVPSVHTCTPILAQIREKLNYKKRERRLHCTHDMTYRNKNQSYFRLLLFSTRVGFSRWDGCVKKKKYNKSRNSFSDTIVTVKLINSVEWLNVYYHDTNRLINPHQTRSILTDRHTVKLRSKFIFFAPKTNGFTRRNASRQS